jgi:hypothetical protein
MEDAPAVKPIVRTVMYFILLGLAAATALASGLVAIWAPEQAEAVAATGGVLTSVAGIVAGGLGVAYRPTRLPSPGL